MSLFKKGLAGLAGAALIVLPTMVQAAGASSLSIANQVSVAKGARVSARTSKQSKQVAGSVVLLVVAGAAVVGGVVAATDDGGSDSASD